MSISKHTSQPIVIVHWPRFGPYHIARLKATSKLMRDHGLHLIALEISTAPDEYLWESTGETADFERITLFSNVSIAKIPLPVLQKRLWITLERISPTAIAINGYASKDSLLLLLWCRLHQCLPILMSDSKYDDAVRVEWKERFKRIIVKQFGAALCGGTPHKAYLMSLGMSAEKIFLGYDAVDNQFFSEQSQQVRKNPQRYRHLPGLADSRPYFLLSGRFIPRKNFVGAVQAYRRYRQKCQQERSSPWRMVILGDGPEREHIQSLIHKYALENDVTLAGVHTIENLPAYYGLASAFIHPAFQEQWGLVVNEAMASHLPVLVSTTVGCALDLITEGVEGFTFSPEDVNELGNKMYLLSCGQIDLQRMGNAAAAKISHWSTKRFAESLYQSIQVNEE